MKEVDDILEKYHQYDDNPTNREVLKYNMLVD